jgi:type II secretory pathway pseudopilin PulG
MRITCARHRTQGTTLVEVVIATFLLGILAGALMGSFSYGFFAMKLVRENQRATQIMLEKVETIRLYRWDQVLMAGFIPDTFTDVFDPQAPNNQKGISYNGTVRVLPYPFNTTYKDNMRQLSVTVSWNSGTVARSRTFNTFIAKDGLQNYVY